MAGPPWTNPGGRILPQYPHASGYSSAGTVLATGDAVKAWQPGDHPTGDDVWVIPLDGSAPRNVTNLAPAQEPSTFCETNLSMVRASKPAWSPDDTRVAFLESATSDVSSGGVSDVGVVDSNGRHRVTVFSSPRPAHCDPHTGMSSAPRGEILAVLGWS